MEQMNVMDKLRELVTALGDSASNEGCSDDLVVVNAAQLWNLQQFMQLLPKASGAGNREKEAAFVKGVAELCIWDYSKDDGSLYKECDEPRDGYLDSHCCLMGLIEQARDVLPNLQAE
jgi:hypothetical protein